MWQTTSAHMGEVNSVESITFIAGALICQTDATQYQRQKYGEIRIAANLPCFGQQGSGIGNLLRIPWQFRSWRVQKWLLPI